MKLCVHLHKRHFLIASILRGDHFLFIHSSLDGPRIGNRCRPISVTLRILVSIVRQVFVANVNISSKVLLICGGTLRAIEIARIVTACTFNVVPVTLMTCDLKFFLTYYVSNNPKSPARIHPTLTIRLAFPIHGCWFTPTLLFPVCTDRKDDDTMRKLSCLTCTRSTILKSR